MPFYVIHNDCYCFSSPARDAELISNNSLKLLQYLEQSNKIHPENPDALLKMLSSIERNDLKKYVKTFMTNRGMILLLIY